MAWQVFRANILVSFNSLVGLFVMYNMFVGNNSFDYFFIALICYKTVNLLTISSFQKYVVKHAY